MKKTYFVLAVATLMISASGCGACRGLFNSTCAKPVVSGPMYSQCAPMCAPSCNTCNSCPSGCDACDGGVTYGFDGGAGATYMPAETVETMPMMMPEGSGSR